VNKLTPAIFADQQKIADTFFKLGLIPKAIDVTEAAWTT
jgi:sulfonate transport system substrate-binding protein